ncbi:28S ribosomal protein S18b, mitochondrial [Wyeomyia smithii]|uniref:28S ribosomal protein S18b, mitochondrial n=1 Tax=Wyeomyia smithii TaxID=174621 RepID=UPI002467BA9D|nr:28S ribosomal protein S18b, mitochondrial [Wyeomyia smithii]
MSLLRAVAGEIFSAYRQGILSIQSRPLCVTSYRAASKKTSPEPAASKEEEQPDQAEQQSGKEAQIDPKDRSRVIPVETSIRYLLSEAYQQTYQGEPVWKNYRRNHKGIYPPRKTRKTCIRRGKISTGNPCPICRDEYLVLDHRNLNLIKQFISGQTGKALSYQITGLCQKRHLELLVAVERALDHGMITFDVPFRQYDYSEYYSTLQK